MPWLISSSPILWCDNNSNGAKSVPVCWRPDTPCRCSMESFCDFFDLQMSFLNYPQSNKNFRNLFCPQTPVFQYIGIHLKSSLVLPLSRNPLCRLTPSYRTGHGRDVGHSPPRRHARRQVHQRRRPHLPAGIQCLSLGTGCLSPSLTSSRKRRAKVNR